jgi:hypothetical protein
MTIANATNHDLFLQCDTLYWQVKPVTCLYDLDENRASGEVES